MGRERGRPIFEPGGFCVPLLGAGLQPARSRAGRGGAHKTILRLSRSGAFRAFSPSANRCKCLRKHRTKLFKERLPLQASIGPLHPVQLLPSRGKGSARIFSLQLEGGVEEARAFGSGRLRRAALVQRFVPSTPAAADGRRAGGCMALGTPRLGCGWDSEATEAGAAEMRVPRGRRSFQAHKGRAKPRHAQ